MAKLITVELNLILYLSSLPHPRENPLVHLIFGKLIETAFCTKEVPDSSKFSLFSFEISA